MSRKIYISSQLLINVKPSEYAEIYPKSPVRNKKDDVITTIVLMPLDTDETYLNINSEFTYDITEDCYKAFEKHAGSNLAINSNVPVIKKFIDEHRGSWDSPNNYLKAIRWLQNLDLQPMRPTLYWSLDGKKSGILDQTMTTTHSYAITLFDPGLLFKHIENGIIEPVSFDIFREAKSLLYTNPRTCHVLLAAALEIGVKEFISYRSPLTGKLLELTKTSPAMEVLITKYLAIIEPNLSFNTDTNSKVRKLFELRNKIVHKGDFFSSPRQTSDIGFVKTHEVFETLNLVSDLLYYLAYYSGETWVMFNKHFLVRRTESSTER